MSVQPLPIQSPRPSTAAPVFEIARSEAQLLTRPAQDVFSWWMRAGAGGMPLRRQFDPLEHRSILPHVFLVEAAADGAFECRLVGEEAKDLLGRNFTRARLTADDASGLDRFFHAHYAAVAASGLCHVCHGELGFLDKDYRRFEAIDCPLAGGDGRAPAILSVLAALPRPAPA